MAEGRRFRCDHCDRAIEAWSDGNPYYLGGEGQKVYVYHPSPDVELAIGNESPYLCLACGAEFEVDSEAPLDACPSCGADAICDAWELEGKPCPACRQGVFAVDPEFHPIS